LYQISPMVRSVYQFHVQTTSLSIANSFPRFFRFLFKIHSICNQNQTGSKGIPNVLNVYWHCVLSIGSILPNDNSFSIRILSIMKVVSVLLIVLVQREKCAVASKKWEVFVFEFVFVRLTMKLTISRKSIQFAKATSETSEWTNITWKWSSSHLWM
jgi:hypothetical protein